MIEGMRIGAGLLTHGGCPSPATYDKLRSQALDCWWNLALELHHLIPDMQVVAREVLWAKIPDHCAPVDPERFAEQAQRVCAVLRDGGHVHVSCFGGSGRTGLAIACIRVRALGEPPADAISASLAVCGGPVHAEQKEFVHGFASVG